MLYPHQLIANVVISNLLTNVKGDEPEALVLSANLEDVFAAEEEPEEFPIRHRLALNVKEITAHLLR